MKKVNENPANPCAKFTQAAGFRPIPTKEGCQDMTQEKRRRIPLLDVLRGFSILLMILHHAGYDLVLLGVLPAWVLYNKAGTGMSLMMEILHPVFAGTFVALSGVSSRLSRSNVKRGLLMLSVAVWITTVTVFAQIPILFGIIHFLAAATLLYAVLRPLLERIPSRIQPFLFLALAVPCYLLLPVDLGRPWLFWMGLGVGPDSYDYFPLLKWFFIYLFGTWLGGLIVREKLPAWFYAFDIPALSWVGRKSLVIYLVHQPVLFVLWWALERLGIL